VEALRLDGNAAAGLLCEIFAQDVTASPATCDGCGAREQLGAVHLYRGAGLVLRCPHCEAVLVRVVATETRAWIDLRGVRSLELG
jgi:Family of unknown function (DUF6510)